jgi:hypothetical protein
MSIRIIDDNAENTLDHVEPGTFDLAVFNHAVNDILETAAADARDFDTTGIEWWSNERQMIEWLAEDVAAGRLDERGKPELMSIISHAIRLVRPSGIIAFQHHNYAMFLSEDWFPWDFFAQLIPMTRQWVAESDLPVEEFKLTGSDPQWWMFLRVGK